MPRRIESLFIAGSAGKLEALLEEPDDQEPREAVVICHPHPQHGGTMHNKVVYRLARGLRRSGAVVLRFNYRGVNMSEGKYDNGIGETADARSALEFLRSRYPQLPFSIAGFSFGSRIALQIGCDVPGVTRVIAVGFPAASYGQIPGLGQCPIPRTFIVSDHDEFCPEALMLAFFDRLTGPKQLIWVNSDNHFFSGALEQFEESVYRVGTSW